MASFFKVVVLGDGGIGKTSICNYLTTGEFFGSYKLSIGADFFSKKLTIDNEEVTLQICDIGGQDQFAEISNIFTKGAHGAVMCYDTTRRDTLDSLDKWLKQLDDPTIPKVLVSTKNDVTELKEVLDEEGLEAARKLNIPYYIPTTSLEGIGITETFEAISKLMLKAKRNEPLPNESVMIDVTSPEKPEVREVSATQHVSAQPLGIGRVPSSDEDIEPPTVQAPTVSDEEQREEIEAPYLAETQQPSAPETPTISAPVVEEEKIEPPIIEPEEKPQSSFTQPIRLNNQHEQKAQPIEPAEVSNSEKYPVEPPTEPEKTTTQPISTITPPVTNQQPSEKQEEKETKKQKFSFLERLEKERKKHESLKKEENEEKSY